MRLRWNLSAGLANSAWTAVVGLISTPFYLRYLGIEAYGLIGFFAAILVLIQLFDMGIAPTMNREVARYASGGRIACAGNLLRSLEFIYWGMAVLIGACVFLASGWIGSNWLQTSSLSRQSVERAVALMGLLLLIRWPGGLYMGALLGAQRLALVSGIGIAFTTISTVGAILVLALVSPTIETFFTWQALVAVAYVATMRAAAWRELTGHRNARFESSELSRIWKFSAGLAAVTASAIVLSQLDKLVLSRLLPLEAFGRYALAGTIAGSLYLLITPVFNAVYPRFSALVAAGETAQVDKLYGLGTRFLGTFLFPAAITIAVYARPLVHIWTGNAELAQKTAPIASLLVIGSALHGVMYFPYAVQLAFGAPRISLAINLILISLFVPTIVTLTAKYSETGAAMAWLLLHVCYILVGTWLTHRELLRGRGLKWMLGDVGIPLSISFLACFCVSQILGGGDDVNGMSAIVASTLMFIVSVAASFIASPCLWTPIFKNVRAGADFWK